MYVPPSSLQISVASLQYLMALSLSSGSGFVKSPFVKSFLYYVPYACLAAMTFPAILTATAGGILSGLAGLIVALIAAYKEKSLLTVALFACAAVFVTERIMGFMM